MIYLVRDEKVGNFPVRMLVVLVKLSKLIDAKKKLVRQITDLNTEAEKMNLFSDCYPLAFQVCIFFILFITGNVSLISVHLLLFL